MRIFSIFLLAAAAVAGDALASSIVVLEPMQGTAGPSIVTLRPDFAGPSVTTIAEAGSRTFPSVTYLPASPSRTDPSIIVLGEPAASDEEEVAAIPEAAGMAQTPMIIRGGLVGETDARPVPAAAPQASAAPGALDPNDKGTPAKRKALKRQQEEQAAAAAAAAAAPPAAAPQPAAPAAN